MTSPAVAGNRLFKFVRPKLRPQSTDIHRRLMGHPAMGFFEEDIY